MRKFIRVLSVCALAGGAMVLSGCSKKEAAVPAAEPAASTTPVETPVALKVNWVTGKRYHNRMELAQSSETRMSASAQPMKQEMISAQDYAISVLKDREGGGHELELAFLDEKVESVVGGRDLVNFDSWQTPAGKTNSPDAPMFRKLLATRVKYLTDANGKVEAVEDFADFKKQVTDGALPGPKAYFDAMFSEDNLKKMIATAQTLPDHPVKTGDSWPVKLEVTMNLIGTLVLDLNYTLKGWDEQDGRKCARLEYTGGVSVKQSSAQTVPVSVAGSKISGTTWFDPEMGATVESTGSQNMTLKVGSEPHQMTTQTMQKTTWKLLEISDVVK